MYTQDTPLQMNSEFALFPSPQILNGFLPPPPLQPENRAAQRKISPYPFHQFWIFRTPLSQIWTIFLFKWLEFWIPRTSPPPPEFWIVFQPSLPPHMWMDQLRKCFAPFPNSALFFKQPSLPWVLNGSAQREFCPLPCPTNSQCPGPPPQPISAPPPNTHTLSQLLFVPTTPPPPPPPIPITFWKYLNYDSGSVVLCIKIKKM